MNLPVAEDTTQYVDQKSLDVLLQTLIDRIQESDETNRERIEELRQNVTTAIQQSESRNLAATQQLVDERIAKEKAERKSDIDSLSGEIREMSKGIKDLGANVGEMQKGVSNITGLMESFRDVLKARDEKDVETHKATNARIDYQAERLTQHNATLSQVQSDIDNIEVSQGATNSEVKRIRATIHGDPENKDDAPSLFKMMGELKEQMTLGFTSVGNRLDITTEQLGQARADIATINTERAAEKLLWAQRWDGFKAAGKELLKSRWSQLVIGALASGIVLSVMPELREQLSQYLIKVLQGGS
jgi:chromosome segregation ATPase